jgi:hypothetical protein
LFATSTTAATIVTPAATRRVLIFGGSSTDTITLLPDATAVSLFGFQRATTSEPLILVADIHGDIVTRRWTAIASANTPSILVYEGFLSPRDTENLAATIKQMREGRPFDQRR